MNEKFEICEKCAIRNQDDCLIAFGSKECAKILVSGIIKTREIKTETILSMLYDLTKYIHEAINRFMDNQITKEKAIENTNIQLKLIQESLKNYFKQ